MLDAPRKPWQGVADGAGANGGGVPRLPAVEVHEPRDLDPHRPGRGATWEGHRGIKGGREGQQDMA